MKLLCTWVEWDSSWNKSVCADTAVKFYALENIHTIARCKMHLNDLPHSQGWVEVSAEEVIVIEVMES